MPGCWRVPQKQRLRESHDNLADVSRENAQLNKAVRETSTHAAVWCVTGLLSMPWPQLASLMSSLASSPRARFDALTTERVADDDLRQLQESVQRLLTKVRCSRTTRRVLLAHV